MRKEIIRTATISILLTFGALWAEAARSERGVHAPSRLEIRADRNFIKGDYDRAMQMYGKANDALEVDNARKPALQLKMARLYIALQQPQEAIGYYETVYAADNTMLTVNDVCFYTDALRRNGQNQQAESVIRNIAFRNANTRNQRYLNTLQALSNQQHYYAKGSDPCAVEMLEKSSDKPEYWLGKWDGNLFYAVSHSPLQDPLKIFYHRTQYFSLNEQEVIPFHSIPRELQSGPVAFSDDGRMMVATGIAYRGKGAVVDPGADGGMFVTQLYYSMTNPENGRWSRYVPLFDFQEGYSYAHPTFFNGGGSLIFASDRPGGYGGMDLYIAHWNPSTLKWGDPVNLGGLVNTEGDETYPCIVDGSLCFSSNGHEGFGGYDLYRVAFDRNAVIGGTFYHYPYPVNTTCNDFGMLIDGATGYLVSDRRGADGKEDIYRFDNSALSYGRDDLSGVSQEQSAMRGNLNLIAGLKAGNSKPGFIPVDNDVEDTELGEVLLSVYFAFNSSSLDNESVAALNTLLSDPATGNMRRLQVVGYADELGTQDYNQRLSEDRARTVAEYLKQARIASELDVEGRGQIALSPEEYRAAVNEYNPDSPIHIRAEQRYLLPNLSLRDQIRINRVARRVDIVRQ